MFRRDQKHEIQGAGGQKGKLLAKELFPDKADGLASTAGSDSNVDQLWLMHCDCSREL